MLESNKRSKKYSAAMKKPILLAKNSEHSKAEIQSVSQPKFILKSKEKDNISKLSGHSVVKQASKSARKDVREDKLTIASSDAATTHVSMNASLEFILNNNIINIAAFEYLQETNTDFFVVGCVGMQMSGKSTIMNLLASNKLDSNTVDSYFYEKEGVFKIKNQFYSNNTDTNYDNIRLHITQDRIILLDSAPVLCNHFKRDYIVSELDDLKSIILLLTVCHLLIIVQEDYLNINFIRLLLCAEMMTQNSEKREHKFPKILFIKNKATGNDFLPQCKLQYQKIYKQMFKNSRFKICKHSDQNDDLNIMLFPYVSSNKEQQLHREELNIFKHIVEYRKTVFMTPKTNFIGNQEGFTEKMWSQLVMTTQELQNNNYFLRKYENLKEKYNLHNHISMIESLSVKEKGYLKFSDT